MSFWVTLIPSGQHNARIKYIDLDLKIPLDRGLLHCGEFQEANDNEVVRPEMMPGDAFTARFVSRRLKVINRNDAVFPILFRSGEFHVDEAQNHKKFD